MQTAAFNHPVRGGVVDIQWAAVAYTRSLTRHQAIIDIILHIL